MPLPKTIAFTLEGAPVLWRILFDQLKPEQQEKEARFGTEYGGEFVLKWPTAGDRLAIGARAAAMLQAQGVFDAMGTGKSQLDLATAFAFFEQLKEKVPAWCAADTPDDGLLLTAIMRAREEAEYTLREAKKKSVSDGASSSLRS